MWWQITLRDLIPRDEDGVYVCIAAALVLYVLIAYLIDLVKSQGPADPNKAIFDRCFNGATFATCLVLLIGIFVPDTLKAIGNLKLYLLFASVAGMAYSVRALFI